MNYYKYLLLVILFSAYGISAQNNLVSNYSFESNSNCPTAAGQLSYVSDWHTCNVLTPNYFNSCQLVPNTYGVPTNIKGYQFSKTGNAFVGILAYGNAPSTAREYIQSELISPLTAGKSYRVSFNVSLANSSTTAITQLGAYLSTNAISSSTALSLPYTPQIVSDRGNYIIDTVDWVEITAIYNATGGEKFITIGNFKDEVQTDTIQMHAGLPEAYYYIDDVSITPVEAVLTTIPNVFTPNNDGINDQWELTHLPEKSEVKIYNRWGVLVAGLETPLKAEGSYKWDGYTTSGIKCVAGTYYYVIFNGSIKKGFIQLIRDN
ncbi:MAG: gliding motility-associated C-terminal domain-containing protein [Bacteroidia bacterium]